MTACESIRGEWGEICPDCGNRLPAPVTGPVDPYRPCFGHIDVRYQNVGGAAFQITRPDGGRRQGYRPPLGLVPLTKAERNARYKAKKKALEAAS